MGIHRTTPVDLGDASADLDGRHWLGNRFRERGHPALDRNAQGRGRCDRHDLRPDLRLSPLYPPNFVTRLWGVLFLSEF